MAELVSWPIHDHRQMSGERRGPGSAARQLCTRAARRLAHHEEEAAPCLSARSPGDSEAGTMASARRMLALDVCMVLWGLGTWLGVNGLYVQLPLLVERLPEGWALPSFMVVAVQLANSGMLVYAALKRLLPGVSDAPFVYGLLAVGTLALALNAALYDRTVHMFGADRSLAFLALTFFAALVGCTSSVLFYPYMRHFRDAYLATYLVGEGLSGFVPSLLSLVQGVGGEPECLPTGAEGALQPHYPPPRFGTAAFLGLLAGLSAASLASFAAVARHRGFDSERVTPAAAAKDEEATTPRGSLLTARWAAVMALMAAMNALNNGALPSVQSYSCMPYGTRAYHLAVTLSAMANPAACLAGVWLRPLAARALAALLAATAPPLAYILATALLSPAPPLRHTPLGELLIVACWVVVSASISYTRMWVYGWARGGGARGMRLCGAVGQVGSAAGSALLFVLVNYVQLFAEPDRCPPAPH